MAKAKHAPGPWIDWETKQWIHDPHKLLTNTGDALVMGAATEMLAALKAVNALLPEDVQAKIEVLIAKAEGA